MKPSRYSQYRKNKMSDSTITALAPLFVLLLSILILSPILGLFVMWTWNATMPFIFGLTSINGVQGICLSILSGLLLKSTPSTSSN